MNSTNKETSRLAKYPVRQYIWNADKLVRTTVSGDDNPDSNLGAGGKPVA